MSTADKLNKLLKTKNNIRESIISKGVKVPDDAPFAHYPTYISDIKGEGGGNEDLTGSYVIVRYDNNLDDGENFFKKATEMDVSHLDISNMRNMNHMFAGHENLKSLDLSNWDTSNVEHMQEMFSDCRRLHTLRLDNCNRDTIEKIINSWGFPTGQAEDWEETRKIYVSEKYAANLTAPDGWVFVDWETGKEIGGKLTNYEKGMFSEKRDIEEVSVMVTEEHTDLSDMFQDCENLKTINGIKDWNTSNVETMAGMFAGCKSLESLDLSSFNTSQVTNMTYMFSGCENLRELNLSNFDMCNISETWNTSEMFQDCHNLQILRLDNCSKDTIRKIAESGNLPEGGIKGEDGWKMRVVYARRNELEGIEFPNGWDFSYID